MILEVLVRDQTESFLFLASGSAMVENMDGTKLLTGTNRSETDGPAEKGDCHRSVVTKI